MFQKSTDRKLYFAYENAGDASDAVTIAMRQLIEGLTKKGLQCEVLQPTRKRQGAHSLIQKLFGQCRFFLGILIVLLPKMKEHCIVVTLDAPAGLRLLTEWIAKISRGRVTHVPWIMDLYRFIGSPTNSWSLGSLQRKLDQVALEKTDHAVVLGTCMAKVAKSQFNINPEVIPIWQDASKSSRPGSDRLTAFRNKHNLVGKFVVLYSGTARSLHPLGGLVQAASLLEAHTNIEFLVIGRGSEVERIRSELQVTRLSNLQVLDYLPADDVAVAAHTADVHVVALAESATGTCVPSKGYAAMAAGKPILYIGASSGHLAQDILQADAGAVFGERETVEVAQYLLDMASDVSLLQQRGKNAQAYFEAHRTSAKGVETWADYIRTL